MSKQRRSFLALAGAMAASTVGLPIPVLAQSRELVLGIVNPMTGPGADLGISGQQAIDPFIEEINNKTNLVKMIVNLIIHRTILYQYFYNLSYLFFRLLNYLYRLSLIKFLAYTYQYNNLIKNNIFKIIINNL